MTSIIQKYKEQISLIILLIVTFYTYSEAIGFPFVNFDDHELILKNRYIKELTWDNIKYIFTNFYWYNYQPLTLLSFALEFHFFGINSHVVHFNNILLHLCNVILVYVMIKKLSERYDISIITAILFAIHPTRVESVVWATERKDVLYTFFFLLSTIQYINYIKNDFKAKNYLLAFIFFILSCFTKGMAVSLTLLLFVIDYFYKRKMNMKFYIDKIPFLITSLIFGIIVTTAVQSEDIQIINKNLDITERFRLASLGFLMYLKMFIYPFNLCSFHSYPEGIIYDVPFRYYIFPIIGLLLTIIVLLTLRFTRKVVFGYFFMVVTIVMVLQLYVTNNAFIAEHYTYIPYIGLFYLCGEFFAKIVDYYKEKWQVRFSLTILVLFVSIGLAYASKERTKVWRNSLALWDDVVEKYPNSYKSYNGRGYCYVELKDYRRAIADYTRAIELNPNFYIAWYNRGNAYSLINERDSAYRDYMKSLKLNYKNSEAFNNIGVLFKEKKEYEKALKAFDASLYLNQSNPIVYCNKASVLIKQQKFDEAITNLNKALELDPYLLLAHNYLSNIYTELKNCEKAEYHVEKAIKIAPYDGNQYIIKANFYINCLNDTDKACFELVKAQQFKVPQAIMLLNKYCANPELKVAKILPIKTQRGKVIYYENGAIMFETVDSTVNGKVLTFIRNYYPNGILREAGVIDKKTGKYNGEIRWYNSKGKDSIIGYYRDKTPYGKWREFYPNGKIMAEYSFENGEMHGIYKYYYENGKIWTEREYKYGKLWNVISLYDINGNPLDHGTLKDGNGSLKVYDEKGKLIETLYYIDGKTR